MPKKRKALSQAEIWDDSALLQSWDEAVEEYQLYHSIHARGERVEDILKKATTQEAAIDSRPPLKNPVYAYEDQELDTVTKLEDGELDEGPTNSVLMQQEPYGHPIKTTTITDAHFDDNKTSSKSQQDPPTIPQTLAAGSAQDQGLKNLMMSWYWAGYYTGYYEGASQARQEHAQSKKGENPDKV